MVLLNYLISGGNYILMKNNSRGRHLIGKYNACRLDYWLVSKNVVKSVHKAEIRVFRHRAHNAVILEINKEINVPEDPVTGLSMRLFSKTRNM